MRRTKKPFNKLDDPTHPAPVSTTPIAAFASPRTLRRRLDKMQGLEMTNLDPRHS